MESEQVTSETPFLEKVPISSFDQEGSIDPLHKVGWFRKNKRCLLSNSIVVIICAMIVVIDHLYLSNLQCVPQSLVYTPARKSLEYVRVRMDTAGVRESKYLGFNRKADEAWRDLTSRNHVRLREEDLLAINQTSISLGSGGYLGMLAVYHELHCVKWIRWALDNDRYKDRFSAEDMIDLPTHIEHCLDIVRQSIQCRANTAIVTYGWNERSRVPKTSFHGHAECMNWEKFEAWAEKHTVNILEPGELNHPTYGQSFPEKHKLVEDGIPAILPFVKYEGKLDDET